MQSNNPLGPTDRRWALSASYAAMFGHLGIVLPFFAPWLQGRGVGALGIGVLMALPPLFKIAAPWLWGSWADRTGRRRPLLVVACCLAAAALAVMTLPASLPVLVLLIVLYGFARAPIIPFLEATALEQAESRGVPYGPIRLWGSVSFMLVSSVFGALRGPVSDAAGLWLAAALLGVCGLLAAIALPDPICRAPGCAEDSDRPSRAEAVVQGNGAFRLLAACALMQASHGAYYTFYSIHLARLGYSSASIGALWALGVLCEVLLLSRADLLLRRFGSGAMMRACLLLAALRWLMIGAADGAVVLVGAQVLHSASYAGFHVAAIREVYREFGAERRASGQAMYSGMTFGLGMFVGSLAAGWLAGLVGLPATFIASSAVALLALPVLGRFAGPAGSSAAVRRDVS